MTTPDPPGRPRRPPARLDAAWVMAIYFVVAVAVWGLIGFVLDLLLTLQPWLTFVGLLIGTGVGLLLAQRRAGETPSPAREQDAVRAQPTDVQAVGGEARRTP